MLESGCNIRMVSPIGEFNFVGYDFEVVNSSDNGISFKSNFGMGFMTEDEFKKHFIELRKSNWRE